jgi:hypothetical protein
MEYRSTRRTTARLLARARKQGMAAWECRRGDELLQQADRQHATSVNRDARREIRNFAYEESGRRLMACMDLVNAFDRFGGVES